MLGRRIYRLGRPGGCEAEGGRIRNYLGIGIQQLSECRRAYALLLFFGEFFPVPLFSLELNKQASKKRRLKDMIVVCAEFFAKNVNQYMEASKREKVVIAHKNGTETVLYNPETAERK